MRLPGGDLLRSRVVRDPATALTDALDCRLTGYGVLEPQDAVLLDGDGRGVLVFEDGVPTLAYHTGTDRGGPAALADLAVPGPYRAELVSLAPDAVTDLRETAALEVPPGMPAERLAGNPSLADRTRQCAPESARRRDGDAVDGTDDGPTSAVEAFLEDEEKIAAIREQARDEARARAEEWGLDTLASENDTQG